LATPHENVVPLLNFATSDYPTETMEQRITYARVRSGLTIAAISAAMGIHKDYYILIERKCDRIGPDNLLRFCAVTGVDPSWIVYGNDPPPSIPLTAPTIGQRLRQFRTLHGITCKALSQTAFGVSKQSSLPLWETDRMMPELRTLMRIANAYGISVMSFIPHSKSGE